MNGPMPRDLLSALLQASASRDAARLRPEDVTRLRAIEARLARRETDTDKPEGYARMYLRAMMGETK